MSTRVYGSSVHKCSVWDESRAKPNVCNIEEKPALVERKLPKSGLQSQRLILSY